MAGNHEIKTGGKDFLDDAAKCLAQCFHDDPALTFMLNFWPREQRIAYHEDYFRALVRASVLNNSVITQIDDFSACAIWIPPGSTIDNWRTHIPAGLVKILWDIGLQGCYRMLFDTSAPMEVVKKREATKFGKYWYLFFVATVPEKQGKGLGSALIRDWQKRAAKEQTVIWLEATTPNSHRLYQRLGFEDVFEFRLGEGKAAADGSVKKGGEGVQLWGMVWQPPKESSP